MSRPLFYAGSGQLHEMTDAEMNYTVYRILVAFAALESNMSLTTSSSGTNYIGYVNDTYRSQAVGTHPATTSFQTTERKIYQRTAAATGTVVRLLKFSSGALREMTDSDLNTHLLDRCVAEISAGGIGSYQMGSSAPNDGGTWTARITLADLAQGANRSFYIYQKTNGPAPTVIRPVYFSDSSGGVREAPDSVIDTLAIMLANRMSALAKNQYRLATSTPGGGTWIDVGTYTDRRRQVGGITYQGTYYQYADYAANYYQFADYAANYYQFADYAATYYQFANYRRRIGYVSTYSGFNGLTYYQFADYRKTIGYTAHYRASNAYTAHYRGRPAYTAHYRGRPGYTGGYTANTVLESFQNVANFKLYRRI